MPALHVTDTNFETEVLNQPGTVLVDFHATWCPPCRRMGPIVDEVADEQNGDVRVVKADVDQAPEAARQFSVTSIPAFFVLEDGKVINQFTGSVSKEALLQAIATSPAT